jgi:hypothetical protein
MFYPLDNFWAADFVSAKQEHLIARAVLALSIIPVPQSSPQTVRARCCRRALLANLYDLNPEYQIQQGKPAKF